MSDIVERLQNDPDNPDVRVWHLRGRQALDEIEHLRDERAWAGGEIERLRAEFAKALRLVGQTIPWQREAEIAKAKMATEIKRLRKDYEGLRQIASAQQAEIVRLRAEAESEEPGTPLGRLKALAEYAGPIYGLCTGIEAKPPELFLIDEIERLRTSNIERLCFALGSAVSWADEMKKKDAEIERLRTDKEAISQTASDYLHEIERLRAENKELHNQLHEVCCERNDLKKEIERLQAALQEISKLTPFYEPWADIARRALEFEPEGGALG